MKKISLFILTFLFSIAVFGQAEKLNAIFDKYQDKEGVTSIKIAKPMFKMLGSLKLNDDELGRITPLLGKVNGLKMLVIEKSEVKGDLSANLRSVEKDIILSISALKYQDLVTVNSNEAKIKFLAQDVNSDVVENLILNISSDDNTILMMLDGKISMNDINTLMAETKEITAVNPVTTINNQGNVGSVRNVSAFMGVEVSGGINIEFTQGPETSVVVKTDPEKQQYVVTEVEGGILKVYIRNKGIKNLNINNLKVEVSSPNLHSVYTKAGASFKTKNEVQSKLLELKSSSGSNITGAFKVQANSTVQAESGSTIKADLVAKIVGVEASSGSTVKLVGSANEGSYSASSGSAISATDFVVKSAVAEASSGASVRIHTTESIVASASSAASIHYKGNPSKVTKSAKEITGASILQIN